MTQVNYYVNYYVFLDIDGVLLLESESYSFDENFKTRIKKLVDLKNIVLKKNINLHFVLSSSWRIFNYDYIFDKFKNLGLELSDKTPILRCTQSLIEDRKNEINKYIENKKMGPNDKIVVIDDFDLDLQNSFVHVDPSKGFDNEHVDQILKIFGIYE